MTTPLTDGIRTFLRTRDDFHCTDTEVWEAHSGALESQLTRLTLIAECLAADLRAVRPKAESIKVYDQNRPTTK